MFIPPKAITVIIHPNTTMRTYATAAGFPRKDPDDNYVNLYNVSSAHPRIAPLVRYLLDQPYVKSLNLSRDGLRVEATEFYEDKWDLFNQDIVNIVNATMYGGEATVTTRDEAAARKAEDEAQRCEVCGHHRREHTNRAMEDAFQTLASLDLPDLDEDTDEDPSAR